MSWDITLTVVLHLLVFAYWLGGDIGVFYSSFILTDAEQPVDARIAAAKILQNVDMVPRICLLLTLPTGLALSVAKGWIAISSPWIFAVAASSIIWIFVIVRLHMGYRTVFIASADRIGRYCLLFALLATSAAGIIELIELPLFISLKLLALGTAVALGLFVRRLLNPFGPAFAKLVSEGQSDQVDTAIAQTIGRTRYPVMVIWLVLISAAFLGVMVPA